MKNGVLESTWPTTLLLTRRNSVSSLAIAAALAVLPAAAAAAAAAAQDASPAAVQPQDDEIVVTARKRTETATTVPIAITSFGDQTLTALKITSFGDYAVKVPNLSFAYGTGNLGFSSSRTVAIRGIVGRNTTGFYIDDVPVFDTMDPRVVDLERIEVLKGPQGTLFGSGSVGGTVRLVTKKPDLSENSYRVNVDGGYTAHASTADYGSDVMANIVAIPDKLALRAIAYYDHEGGFLERTYPSGSAAAQRETSNNQGANRSFGGSLSALAKLTDNVSATARIMYQNSEVHGFPAAYAPLPDFKVKSLTLDRDQDLQERAKDRWILPSLELRYAGDGWSATSSTSYFVRKQFDQEDSTEATKQILSGIGYTPEPGPIVWRQPANTKRFTQETRVNYDNILSTSGVAGIYYSRTTSHGGIPNVTGPGIADQGLYSSDVIWNYDSHITSNDFALFGEIYGHISDKLTLTLGARAYRYSTFGTIDIDGFFNGGTSHQVLEKFVEKGVSPKVSIDYKITPRLMVYATASRGFRPGGRGTSLPSVCDSALGGLGYTTDSASSYDSDKVWNYEAGIKGDLGPRLSASASAFRIDWSNIQQSIYLPQCGFNFTANSGAARIQGTEWEINGRVFQGFDVRLGFGYQDAKITNAGAAPRPKGSRILQVPKYTATGAAVYNFRLTPSVNSTISVDYSQVGSSLSANSSSENPLVRKSYGLANARIAFDLGKSEISFYAKNIFNQRANLGDIQFIGFAQSTVDAQGNAVALPRVVVSRPVQLGMQYRIEW